MMAVERWYLWAVILPVDFFQVVNQLIYA